MVSAMLKERAVLLMALCDLPMIDLSAPRTPAGNPKAFEEKDFYCHAKFCLTGLSRFRLKLKFNFYLAKSGLFYLKHVQSVCALLRPACNVYIKKNPTKVCIVGDMHSRG